MMNIWKSCECGAKNLPSYFGERALDINLKRFFMFISCFSGTISPLKESKIGIIRGNPGVFQLYPYPTH